MTVTDLEGEFQRNYRNVQAVKTDQLLPELEHARFRDSDLSIKGGALLAFAGLMLACDFVFLSAGPETFLAPLMRWDAIGLVGALVLTVGAFCALRSILISDRHKVPASDTTEVARKFLVSVVRFHVNRRAILPPLSG
jgi:hypothetical protein